MVYIDDLLAYAADFQGALQNLHDVLQAICQARLCLNPKKCYLFHQKVSFLGHVISEEGIATDPTKVATVREWPAPSDVAKLCSFLGLASYYRRFIKGFATIASPLHQLTQKGQDFQ